MRCFRTAYVYDRRVHEPADLVQETDEWDASLAPEVHDYPQVLRDLGTSILLVAATYDATTTEHVCSITEA